MLIQSHPESIAFHFSILTDPRIDRTKDHALHDILVIALCAMLCGAEGFVDFEDFGNARRDWFLTMLELPNGIPSHDTFRRVFALLDPKEFSECFRNWTEGVRKFIQREIVALDGKTLKGSQQRSKGREPIHMVSAWARENGLVLGQTTVNEKSNEITAIPELLRTLNLAQCIVTIDALGCQTKIAAEIIAAKADYVLALKEWSRVRPPSPRPPIGHAGLLVRGSRYRRENAGSRRLGRHSFRKPRGRRQAGGQTPPG